MERNVDSPGNVLVTQDFHLGGLYYENGIKLNTKVEELKNIKVDLLSKLKTEFKLWMANVDKILKDAENLGNELAAGRFIYEASVRDLMEKMEEADELYRNGKLAESLVVEELKRSDKVVGVGQTGGGEMNINQPFAQTFGNINI